MGLRRVLCPARLALAYIAFSSSSYAITSLDDEQMSQVDGAGIAMVLENIRAVMAPTSYIETIGSPETGTQASNGTWLLGWGNYQWMGLSMTGTGAGMAYNGSCSTSGSSGDLGCPIGTGAIANMAAFDNPYLLRVYSYSGYDMANNANVPNTVVELLGPNDMDTYRWAFWGQIASMDNGTGKNVQDYLQSQTIIEGKPATFKYSPLIAGTQTNGSAVNPMIGSTVRLFRTTTTNTSDANYSVLGMNYISTLSGNFRFSVGQQGGSGASVSAINNIPVFDDQEGLFFKNVYAYLPMGQLNYQSLVVNANGTSSTSNGNFVVELTEIPTPNAGGQCVYGESSACAAAYGLISGDTTGYATAFSSRAAFTGSGASYGNAVSGTGYYQTHGYVEWGFYAPGCTTTSACQTAPSETSTSDGMYFVSGNGGTDSFTTHADSSDPYANSSSYTHTNTQVNIGTSHIEGLLLQHMKITSLGAGH